MGLRETLAEEAERHDEPAWEEIDKELKVKRKIAGYIDGEEVSLDEYEDAEEGDFLKICADDEETGVLAEYSWFTHKYPGAVRILQRLTHMKINGENIRCDILTLQLPDGGTRKVYFDISSFFGIEKVPQTAQEKEQKKRARREKLKEWFDGGCID